MPVAGDCFIRFRVPISGPGAPLTEAVFKRPLDVKHREGFRECEYLFMFTFGTIGIKIKREGLKWVLTPRFQRFGESHEWKRADYAITIPCATRTPGGTEAVVRPEFSRMLWDATRHGDVLPAPVAVMTPAAAIAHATAMAEEECGDPTNEY